MLLTGSPQFETQDDFGTGRGIPSVPEWYLDLPIRRLDLPYFQNLMTDEAVWNVFVRLRNVFERAQVVPLSTTKLHDLTCFVLHRLLPENPDFKTPVDSSLTECMRYGIILYMLVIHGTTYYPHTFLLNQILSRFETQLAMVEIEPRANDSLHIWLLTTGMAASVGTKYYPLLSGRARAIAASLRLCGWNDVTTHVQNALWLETSQDEQSFRPHWDAIRCQGENFDIASSYIGMLEPPASS